MSAGDKFVVATSLVIAVGWIGYERGYSEGHGHALECSARAQDGRPLLTTIREERRVLCVYADPMPKYDNQRSKKPWT